jgi:hypothetical protein
MKSELLETDFISDRHREDPGPMLTYFLLLLATGIFICLMAVWQVGEKQARVIGSPFLQVTNQEISRFLYQHPAMMRINTAKKSGYLPGFDMLDRGGVKEGLEKEAAVAPPSILMHYHTWSRLLGSQIFGRQVSDKILADFRADAPYWLEEEHELQAAEGWMNYYLEGPEINAVHPSYGEVSAFLSAHPKYSRHFWQNFYPDYLLGLESSSPRKRVPQKELTPFLRVAIFNFNQR